MHQLSKNVPVFHVKYFLSSSNLHMGHFSGTPCISVFHESKDCASPGYYFVTAGGNIQGRNFKHSEKALRFVYADIFHYHYRIKQKPIQKQP